MIRKIADHIQVSLVFGAVIFLGFEFFNTAPLDVDTIVENGLPQELLVGARAASFKETLGIVMVAVSTLFLVSHWITNPLDVICELCDFDDNKELFERLDECFLVFVALYLLVFVETCCLLILFYERIWGGS